MAPDFRIFTELIKLVAGVMLHFMCISVVCGQNLPRPSYITTEDGLRNRFVTSVCMDNRNLIWIGTNQGLERFDGIEFLRIHNQKSSDIYFPGTDIAKSGIVMLNSQTLWVLADEKIYSWDLCTYHWSEFKLPEAFSGKVSGINKTGENEVFIHIRSSDKILLIQYRNGNFQKIGQTEKSKYNVTHAAVDSEKKIWWSTPLEGIKIYNPKVGLEKIIKPDSIIWYGLKLFVVPVFIDSKDRIFFFPKSVNELWMYDPVNNSHTVIAANLDSPVYYALEDSQGNVWFASRKKLLRLRQKEGESILDDETGHIAKRFNYTQINQLYEDNDKVLWIATNNGLIKLPVGPQWIDRFLVVPDQEWGNEMRGIFEAGNGDIYTFCENYTPGLHRIKDGKETTGLEPQYYPYLKKYGKIDGGNSFCYHKKLDKAYFLINDLMSVDVSKNQVNVEWACDEITEKLERNPLSMLSDSILILGHTLSKTTLYDPVNKKVLASFRNLPNSEEIKNICFADDRSGNIWIGTSAGLYIVSREGKLLDYFHTESNPALPNNTVLTIRRDRNHNMWLGTLGGGVVFVKLQVTKGVNSGRFTIDYKKSAFEFIGKEDGLPNENVPGILEDDYGNMWFSTYDGLVRYQTESDVFQTFLTLDGISNNEFNYTSAFKDSKGNLWFGGLNGLNKINPDFAVNGGVANRLSFTSFSKYNRRSRQQERTFIHDNDDQQLYQISPFDSWFQFNWTLPDYINYNKNNYYVKLDGLNEDWQYHGNQAYIRYHSLAPGQYRLHIRGVDGKGIKSQGEISVRIKVNPIFYETWWFRLLVMFFAGGIIYAIYRYNLNKKLEMERMRVRIASDLHDEVGSMLSGLAMQGELLAESSGKSEKPKLEKIAGQSREVLSKMRDLVWSIDSRRDTVQNLLDRMREILEELLYPKDIRFEFETGELPLNKDLPVNIRQHLFLIFKEAVTNVVRHSNADHVYVYVGNLNQDFVMIIKDNGSQSLHPSTTGMGILNMKMRADKIGATPELNMKTAIW
ncbi:MAG: hypothetical protein IPM26_12845 [Saprospiraceae bacterium]|nr:hypothetical protein [Saprospiraceae bacterium]